MFWLRFLLLLTWSYWTRIDVFVVDWVTYGMSCVVFAVLGGIG